MSVVKVVNNEQEAKIGPDEYHRSGLMEGF